MKKIITTIAITIALVLGIASTNLAFAKSVKKEQSRTIPYPKGYDTKSEGASAYMNKGNHKDSKYFSNLDYFNFKSNKKGLTILSHYRTYQQTKEYSCGPATALMVLDHYGKLGKWEELKIAEEMQTHKDLNGNNTENPGVANERGEWGTSTDRMVKFFNKIEWDVQSSLDRKTDYSFNTPVDFKDWVIKNVKNSNPIMVEWVDWGAHWQSIIGYDTMGTKSTGDDVIILADPYDTSDHKQDGYYVYPVERFFYMWMDKSVLPESQSVQQWIIAKPKK